MARIPCVLPFAFIILHLLMVVEADINATNFTAVGQGNGGNHRPCHGEKFSGSGGPSWIDFNEVYPNHGISADWKLAPSPKSNNECRKKTHPKSSHTSPEEETEDATSTFYVVKAFPMSEGRSVNNYGPRRNFDITFDTIVISQIAATDASRLGAILEVWKASGFSSHFIVTEHFIVRWIAPQTSKGQMAGPNWNGRSIEILIMTDATQSVRQGQIKLLKLIIDLYSPSTSYNIDIKYLLSHHEANGSGSNGVVTNIDDVRSKLCLTKPLP